ncbi:hypothetical protein ENBRE01_1216 [Enteropsectra breve]|nr:hypothetical protein ENBRE01_1216 [Enteropsectra breve]
MPKISLQDAQHIIGQIKRASPPSTKEEHKMLNNLAVLLEKNTCKKDTPLEAELTACLEKMNERFLDLCFFRKEKVSEYAAEYSENINKVLERIRQNNERISRMGAEEPKALEWNLSGSIDDLCGQVPDIFGKLRKAKSIIEESLEERINVDTSSTPEQYLEASLNKMREFK